MDFPPNSNIKKLSSFHSRTNLGVSSRAPGRFLSMKSNSLAEQTRMFQKMESTCQKERGQDRKNTWLERVSG